MSVCLSVCLSVIPYSYVLQCSIYLKRLIILQFLGHTKMISHVTPLFPEFIQMVPGGSVVLDRESLEMRLPSVR